MSHHKRPHRPAYHRPSYNHHAGFYRSIELTDDLSKPWENSPISDNADLPPEPLKPMFDTHVSSIAVGDTNASSPVSTATSHTVLGSIGKHKKKRKKQSVWGRIRNWLRLVFPLDDGEVLSAPAFDMLESKPSPPTVSKVGLHEWKQYGYWARPILNNVTAVSSETSIDTITLRKMITDMGDDSPDSGRRTPPHKRFIPGSKHRALPPRPERWTPPIPGQPLPFPWEVQLNPLLQHFLWGPSPLTWRLFDDPLTHRSVRFGRTPLPVFVSHQDLAQPATWPFLTHMYVNAVAGDSAPTFPWPFTIHNARGIRVGDVLGAVYEAFWVPVRREEKESWPMTRQDAAMRALEERCHICAPVKVGRDAQGNVMREDFEDCMRRCDALGGVMWFRGIEPTINAGGWMITFGTH
ncbi:hypothetical protein JR316_0008528 [Psilocybe cubensis]|uniref:DUF6699 domain-containing protein n=2 Tax=Psilocybe cubensis TaxID=181762 RepID=A0A8H7XLJ4_PSICU|nr:hypothetical protein JR316_0008528 [Psilocybe cubensis]KAH9479932.1 hypothetical protein JR316_0008528 [Psilocybe cubensis]